MDFDRFVLFGRTTWNEWRAVEVGTDGSELVIYNDVTQPLRGTIDYGSRLMNSWNEYLVVHPDGGFVHVEMAGLTLYVRRMYFFENDFVAEPIQEFTMSAQFDSFSQTQNHIFIYKSNNNYTSSGAYGYEIRDIRTWDVTEAGSGLATGHPLRKHHALTFAYAGPRVIVGDTLYFNATRADQAREYLHGVRVDPATGEASTYVEVAGYDTLGMPNTTYTNTAQARYPERPIDGGLGPWKPWVLDPQGYSGFGIKAWDHRTFALDAYGSVVVLTHDPLPSPTYDRSPSGGAGVAPAALHISNAYVRDDSSVSWITSVTPGPSGTPPYGDPRMLRGDFQLPQPGAGTLTTQFMGTPLGFDNPTLERKYIPGDDPEANWLFGMESVFHGGHLASGGMFWTADGSVGYLVDVGHFSYSLDRMTYDTYWFPYEDYNEQTFFSIMPYIPYNPPSVIEGRHLRSGRRFAPSGGR